MKGCLEDQRRDEEGEDERGDELDVEWLAESDQQTNHDQRNDQKQFDDQRFG
jgi:hypothetical protein